MCARTHTHIVHTQHISNACAYPFQLNVIIARDILKATRALSVCRPAWTTRVCVHYAADTRDKPWISRRRRRRRRTTYATFAISTCACG